jgi:hypothetical protein
VFAGSGGCVAAAQNHHLQAGGAFLVCLLVLFLCLFVCVFVCLFQGIYDKLSAMELRQDASASLQHDLARHIQQALQAFDHEKGHVFVCLFVSWFAC